MINQINKRVYKFVSFSAHVSADASFVTFLLLLVKLATPPVTFPLKKSICFLSVLKQRKLMVPGKGSLVRPSATDGIPSPPRARSTQAVRFIDRGSLDLQPQEFIITLVVNFKHIRMFNSILDMVSLLQHSCDHII